ncbi:rod shape-determining protein MreC [Magnetovibrio sp. PR-2]|uniref:rod shape-determining protein MreC n=1 Tax=Magnetovibrio sp. PR-2 TaxID=3120356 RepID=UPI002FCE2162
MSNRHNHVHHLAHAEKGVAGRVGYLVLVLAAFALMLLGKADVLVMERVRASIADAVAPVLDVLSRPAATADNMVDQFNELSALRDENTRLRMENERLIEWQASARKLSSENLQLKSLLNFAPGAEPGFITGRVIADSGGAFVHSLLLNAGSRQNVAKGQAVVTGDGLVGRVHGVGARSARVLLLTDLNSRIPVVVEANRTRAILAGNNSDRPRLIHMLPGVSVTVGDRIVTSGHGGAFPPGIPVGVVAQSSENGVLVKPHVQRDRLEYVRVVDYGLQGILDANSAVEGAGFSR